VSWVDVLLGVIVAALALFLFTKLVELIHFAAITHRFQLNPGIYSAVYVCRLPGIHGLNTYDVGLIPQGLNSRSRCYRLFIDGTCYHNGPPLLVVRVSHDLGRENFLWLPHGVRLEMSNVEIDPVVANRHSPKRAQQEQQLAS
jgi:hypothetical protein